MVTEHFGVEGIMQIQQEEIKKAVSLSFLLLIVTDIKYYVDTVGRNKERIAQYIKNQIEEDKVMDQMTLKEYFDPFNVEKKQKQELF